MVTVQIRWFQSAAAFLFIVAVVAVISQGRQNVLRAQVGGGECTRQYVYGAETQPFVAENPAGTCTFPAHHYMTITCPVNTSVQVISCTGYTGPNGSGQPNGSCLYKFNYYGTNEDGEPYALGQPLYYMSYSDWESGVVTYSCVVSNDDGGGDSSDSSAPASSAAPSSSPPPPASSSAPASSAQPPLSSSVGPQNQSSANPSSNPPPASSSGPQNQSSAASSRASSVSACTQDSDCGSPTSWTYRCSTGQQIAAVNEGSCGTVTFYFYPTCSNGRCNPPPGITLPQIMNACQSALPCPNSSTASSISSRPSSGSSRVSSQSRSSSSNPCPAGYSCMDKELCLASGEQNNGAGNVCGDSTTCCRLRSSGSSRSASSASITQMVMCCIPSAGYQCVVVTNDTCNAMGKPTAGDPYSSGTADRCDSSCNANFFSSSSQNSEGWVFTACPDRMDGSGQSGICVFGTPGQQTCPEGTGPAPGTCKNSKYENDILVAQQVGICCGPIRVVSSASSQSSVRVSCVNDVDCPTPSCTIDENGRQCCGIGRCVNGACTIVSTCSGPSSGSSQSSRSSGSSNSSGSSRSSESSRSSGSSRYSSSRSSSQSSVVVFNECRSDECFRGGDDFCVAQNKTCSLTTTLPCIRCDAINQSSSRSVSSHTSARSSARSSSSILITLEECTGFECQLGGEAVCRAQGMDCVQNGPPTCFTCQTVLTVSSQSRASVTSAVSTSSLAPLSCTGLECALGGDSFCELQGGACTTLSNDPCFTCEGLFWSASSAISSGQFSSGLLAATSSLSYTELFFLGEQCRENYQCVTNLCLNNVCVPCLQNSDCASGICRSGICVNTDVLAETTDDPSQSLGDPSLDYAGDTSGVLPAQVIELPFGTTIDDQGLIIAQDGTPLASGAPVTPSTGPAALAVMLAGAAAGWIYRRKR